MANRQQANPSFAADVDIAADPAFPPGLRAHVERATRELYPNLRAIDVLRDPEKVQRVSDLAGLYETSGGRAQPAMPANLSAAAAPAPKTPQQAEPLTYDKMLELADQARELHASGVLTDDQLTPSGRLLLDVGVGNIDPAAFTPEQRRLIGLAPTLWEQTKDVAAAGADRMFRVEPPRHTTPPWETFTAPINQAIEQPPPVTSAMRQYGGPGSGLDFIGRTLAGVEKVLTVGMSPLIGGASLIEQGLEQSPRLAGGEPTSTAYSRFAGALAEAAGWLVGLPKVKGPRLVREAPGAYRTEFPKAVGPYAGPVPDVVEATPMRQYEQPAGPQQRMLGPGSNQGVIVPESERLLGRALPEGPRRRALPAGEPQPRAIEAGSNQGVVVPREQQYPGPAGPQGPPPPPPKALPAGPRAVRVREFRPVEEPVEVAGPPEPQPGSVVDPQGRPVEIPSPTMAERERLRIFERSRLDRPARAAEPAVELPAVPEGDLPTAAGAGLARRGQEPLGLPKPPETPPPSAAKPKAPTPPPPPAPAMEPAIGVKRPAAKPKAPPPAQETIEPAGPSRVRREGNALSLKDPDDVVALIAEHGGLRWTPKRLGGMDIELEGVPHWVFRKGGKSLDEIATDVAKARGGKPRQVEREISETLTNYRRLKEQKRRNPNAFGAEEDMLGVVPPERRFPEPVEEFPPMARAAGEEIPADLAHMVTPEEWATMDAQQRSGFIGLMREFGEGKPAEAATPPKFEKTAIGDQAMVPGAEKRAIPETKLKAPGAQKPVEDSPLFGQEKRAREEASDAAQQALPGQEPPKAPPSEGAPRLSSIVPPVPLPGPEEGQEDTLEGKAQRLAQVAGLALPLAFAILSRGRRAGRPSAPRKPGGTPGALPEAPSAVPRMSKRAEGAPPEVPAAFRREEVGPPRAAPPPVAPEVPPAQTAQAVRQAVQEAKASLSGAETPTGGAEPPLGGGPPFQGPPGAGMNLPGDLPDAPIPPAGRVARMFGPAKAQASYFMPPEEVVRGYPAGDALVRLTYRSYENGKMLVKEFDNAIDEIIGKVSDADMERVKRFMDTGQGQLTPELADVATRVRQHLDVLADAVGLPRADRIENYFPRLRDTMRVEETKLILDPNGNPYMGKTFMQDLPRSDRYEAFFTRQRTARDPAGLPAKEALRVYNRATARHLTMNGGYHPFTNEVLPGYLNQLQPLLSQQDEVFKGFLARFVNDYLGATPPPGQPVWHQRARIVGNIEFASRIGGNVGSVIANTTQQINTLAHVGFDNYLLGYRDMLDPARRAIARRFIGLEELAKADLEQVQNVVTRADRIESLTSKLAHVSGGVFRKAEMVNRYHAFLAGMREGERLGLQGRAAIEFARDVVENTQFSSAGPAKIMAMRGPGGRVWGQFKSFQTRQTAFIKNLVTDDIKDFAAAMSGQSEAPITIMGRTYARPDGTLVSRPLNVRVPGTGATVPLSRFIPMRRTAAFLLGLTAIGGPDAIWPGFDEYLREQGVKIPGLLPAIGVGVANMMGYGFVDPGDVTRSLLFFMPGPLIGHIQDAGSAATGVNWGRGLTEMLHGDIGQPLTMEQRVDRAIRALPVAGIALSRARNAASLAQTPGQDREALTLLESLGLRASSGRLQRRTEKGEPVRVLMGLPPQGREQQFEEQKRLGTLDERARAVVEHAGDLEASGRAVEAQRALRDGERQLGLPPGSLEIGKRTGRAAEERRLYTPLERQQKRLEGRFPLEVESSRRRFRTQEPPDARGLRGLGLRKPGL